MSQVNDPVSVEYVAKGLPWILRFLLIENCPPCASCQEIRSLYPELCNVWDIKFLSSSLQQEIERKSTSSIGYGKYILQKEVSKHFLRLVTDQSFYHLLDSDAIKLITKKKDIAPHLAFAQWVFQALEEAIQDKKHDRSESSSSSSSSSSTPFSGTKLLSMASKAVGWEEPIPAYIYEISKPELDCLDKVSIVQREGPYVHSSVEYKKPSKQHLITYRTHQASPFIQQQRIAYAFQRTLCLPLPFCVPLTLPLVFLPQSSNPELLQMLSKQQLNTSIEFRPLQKDDLHGAQYAVREHPFRMRMNRTLQNTNSFAFENGMLWVIHLSPEHNNLIPISQLFERLVKEYPGSVVEEIRKSLLQQLMIWWYWMFVLFHFLHGNISEKVLYVRTVPISVSKTGAEIVQTSSNSERNHQGKRFYSFKDLDHEKEINEEGVWIDFNFPFTPVLTSFECANVSGELLENEILTLNALLHPTARQTGQSVFSFDEVAQLHSQELLSVLKFDCFKQLFYKFQDLFEKKSEPDFCITALDILRRLGGVTPKPDEEKEE